MRVSELEAWITKMALPLNYFFQKSVDTVYNDRFAQLTASIYCHLGKSIGP